MTTVRHIDLRELGYCNPGARRWFREHGLDWAGFLREGLPAEVLAAFDDAMVAAAIRRAEERERCR